MKIGELNDLIKKLNAWNDEVNALNKHPRITGASTQSQELRDRRLVLMRNIRTIEEIEL